MKRIFTKPASIAQSKLWQAAIQVYNDALAQLEALPADAKSTQPDRFVVTDAAFNEARDMLVTVIDFYCSQIASQYASVSDGNESERPTC